MPTHKSDDTEMDMNALEDFLSKLPTRQESKLSTGNRSKETNLTRKLTKQMTKRATRRLETKKSDELDAVDEGMIFMWIGNGDYSQARKYGTSFKDLTDAL